MSATTGDLYGTWDAKRDAVPALAPAGPVASGPSGRTNYGRTILEAECRRVAQAATGERNDALNVAAVKVGRAVAGGHIDHDDARAALTAAGHGAGLTARETYRTISSGMRTGLQYPRDAGEAQQREAVSGLTDITARLAGQQPTIVVTQAEPALDLSSYLRPGGTHLLNLPENPVPVWGAGDQVLWAKGEALMIAGGPGLGKTTLAGQLVRARMGLQASVLDLPVAAGTRVLYLGMDRPQQIGRALLRTFSRAELEEYGDDRLWWGDGPPPQDLARHPELLAELCAYAKADTVVVDSVKDAAIGLTDDEVGAGYNRSRQIAVAAGVQVLELHHLVKRGANGSAPSTLADVYGSAWLTAGIGSLLLLTGEAGDPIVRATHLKQPREAVGPLELSHDHQAGVTTISERVDLLQLLAMTQVQTAESAARQLYSCEQPTKAEREKARRRLEALVKAGHAYTRPGRPGGDGGALATTYHPHTLPELRTPLED